jgi:hypothetical protein
MHGLAEALEMIDPAALKVVLQVSERDPSSNGRIATSLVAGAT